VETAVHAAEVFSFGRHCDVAPLVWLHWGGRSRYGDPSLRRLH
jgi:hypothetical protein